MARWPERIGPKLRPMSRFYQLDFEKAVVAIEQKIEAAETRLQDEIAGASSAAAADGQAPSSPAVLAVQAEIEGLRSSTATC